MNDSPHLTRKCARIFVHEHHPFRYANSFPRVELKENCKVRRLSRTHCLIFPKRGILDISQVNALQIAEFMFYHNQPLPPMFLSWFSANKQVRNYDTWPIAIDHMTFVIILNNLQYSTKVLKYGILSQYRLPV